MSSSIKVLYVDDEPINLLLFKANFKKKFEVITAKSGNEGLTILNNNPDTKVVISDMKMPGMSGLEFIRIAKQNYPNVSFYILTGFDITDEISNALEEKLIHKYFKKPFNINEIEKAIISEVK
ncbi:MAG TPA: response regulator [Bacteroidales bacterium]|nr:response regulator [Bacteroidales bacterium]